MAIMSIQKTRQTERNRHGHTDKQTLVPDNASESGHRNIRTQELRKLVSGTNVCI